MPPLEVNLNGLLGTQPIEMRPPKELLLQQTVLAELLGKIRIIQVLRMR